MHVSARTTQSPRMSRPARSGSPGSHSTFADFFCFFFLNNKIYHKLHCRNLWTISYWTIEGNNKSKWIWIFNRKWKWKGLSKFILENILSVDSLLVSDFRPHSLSWSSAALHWRGLDRLDDAASTSWGCRFRRWFSNARRHDGLRWWVWKRFF